MSIAEHFFTKSDLDENRLQTLLGELAPSGIDYGDLYFQDGQSESWMLEDGQVKDASFSISQGVGLRANAGEKSGFSYTDRFDFDSLKEAARLANSIVSGGRSATCALNKKVTAAEYYAGNNPIAGRKTPAKIELLQAIDDYARNSSSAVTQVIAGLNASYSQILIAASDGTFTSDQRPLVRLSVSVIAEQDGKRERGSDGLGGRTSFDELFDSGNWKQLVDNAVSQALINLKAEDAPAGVMPVVLGAGWPGVLLHEAVGHGLEGDFNRKGTSAFSGKIGEQVASKLCTVVDDGTIARRRGSLNIDDEGTPTQRNVLIENGILKGYMQDRLNARLMGASPTGNGRRQSYAHLPMPRMTNTFMTAGEHHPEELIESVDKGLYAPNFGGGQVDITSGQFVFSASQAFLIENGKVTRPVKGATLIGNGPEVMKRISMVGNDFSLDPGIGVCGKDGQSVPVGVGQPSLKVDGLNVGGTK